MPPMCATSKRHATMEQLPDESARRLTRKVIWAIIATIADPRCDTQRSHQHKSAVTRSAIDRGYGRRHLRDVRCLASLGPSAVLTRYGLTIAQRVQRYPHQDNTQLCTTTPRRGERLAAPADANQAELFKVYRQEHCYP